VTCERNYANVFGIADGFMKERSFNRQVGAATSAVHRITAQPHTFITPPFPRIRNRINVSIGSLAVILKTPCPVLFPVRNSRNEAQLKEARTISALPTSSTPKH
jgi:hypothetical protein